MFFSKIVPELIILVVEYFTKNEKIDFVSTMSIDLLRIQTIASKRLLCFGNSGRCDFTLGLYIQSNQFHLLYLKKYKGGR